jgi:acetyl esterase/lipase
MKKLLFSFITAMMCMALVQTASAQTCDGQRYYSKVFSSYDKSTVTYSNDNQSMDIYQPHNDTATTRKVILLIHGGSFYAGSRTDAFIVYMCEQFAMRGYVTASIDYTLVPLADITSLQDSATAYPKVIKSISDAKAAVRYLKMSGTSLSIDTSWIVIGGESAGGIIADHVAYVKDYTGVTPLLDSAFVTVGGLDGNSGNPGYSTKCKAVLNYAGALLNLGMLSHLDTEPIYSAQGDADQTVPYQCGQVLGGSSDVTMCGAGAMTPVLTSLSIPNQLETFTGAGHVPWDTNAVMQSTVESQTALFLYKIDCSTFTSIHEISDVNVSLFPNPASKQITIQAAATMESITIVDAMGRVVSVTAATGMESRVNTSTLSTGLYIAKISLKDNEGFIVKPFTVE